MPGMYIRIPIIKPILKYKNVKQMRADNNTIMIADQKGVSVIDINSIVRIEAVNNYSKIFFNDGRSLLVSKVLKRMEALLEGKGFERIHRSHLVNGACI